MQLSYSGIRNEICKSSKELVSKLIEKGLYVSTAESCTGGMVASSIVDIPDASRCFNEAVVTYSNAAKMKYLEVSNVTLYRYGAVSSETVKEMALGLRKQSGCDVSIVTSGIAGPGGGTEEQPVGLVYISASYRDLTFVMNKVFKGDRTMVRLQATLEAIKLGIRIIEEKG